MRGRVLLNLNGKDLIRLKMSALQDDAAVEANSSRSSQAFSAWKPRRYHTKSRTGCLSCKRRRIKCGEERPACRNCWEKALECVYPTSVVSQSHKQRQRLPSPQSPASNWTTLSRSYILPALGQGGYVDGTISSGIQSESTKSDVEKLMEHFLAHTNEVWIGDSIVQGSMQRYIVQASAPRSYLLHTTLAMAAAHISYYLPSDTKYKYLSALHYQFSLEKYCEYLRAGIDVKDTDAMFATCILLAMLTFSHVAEQGSPSSLDEDKPNRIWVRAMQGTKFLLESPVYYPALRTGTWDALVREYDDFDESTAAKYFDPSPRYAEELSLINLLEAACKSPDEDDQQAYSAGILMLKDLVRLRPTPDAIGRFAFTLTRLPHNFYGLVDKGDIRALAIIGFWCGLMTHIQSWWATKSAKVECGRIADALVDHGDARFSEITLFLRACAE